jgi:hypothetical protein
MAVNASKCRMLSNLKKVVCTPGIEAFNLLAALTALTNDQ